MSAEIFDDRICDLGEGPLWHPNRGQLFWFDILGKRLLTKGAEWQFDRHASAAGWIDDDTLLIATETDLIRFDIETGEQERIVALEKTNSGTRSNDGRADPFGGFWIGTMGKSAEEEAGRIYRFYRGVIEPVTGPITIPNAICFAPDGRRAYFADTRRNLVWTQALDSEGWPEADPEIFLDQRESRINPDGAVVDAAGRFWNAEWGNFRVACYDSEGRLVEEIQLPARQPSCPAFGGPDLSDLYVTTAREGLGDRAGAADGPTYVVKTTARGQAEHRVVA
ncbi:SMP-30/gluconolactonase/LRE family protein [Rhodobacterales bacterium HKCCE3408]|nr:SMP-30/gluconolactonase/LRE family protein [Rhodobacterales bacterium HKCCE3408]